MKLQLHVLALSVTLALAGCGGGSGPAVVLPTLDGKPPMVISHRGLPSVYPEEVIEGYKAAIAAGGDALECDLMSSKDHVLFVSHNPWLADTTDIASHPEFASRARSWTDTDHATLDGLSGADGAGNANPDWYISDFTAAELKTLRTKQPNPAERGTKYDGLFPMATLQEVIDLAKATMAANPGRTIYVYPETKNPIYQRKLGVPLEEIYLDMINKAGWNTKDSPLIVQSFDPESLRVMRSLGLKAKAVQLIDGDDYDWKTGKVTYGDPSTAKPYSWLLAADPRNFDAMVTPAGLAEIKTYADGIGPWKYYVMAPKGVANADGTRKDLNGDGKFDQRDVVVTPTTLVADAHKAGLFVHPFTFRSEPRRLASTFNGDPKEEYKAHYTLGVDGVFTDFSDTARTTLTGWLTALGYK